MIKYILLSIGLVITTVYLTSCAVQCPDDYEDIGIGQCIKKSK